MVAVETKHQQPIFIAAPPRCGTTMMAGLLFHHGIWIGRGRITRYPGTNPPFVSENQDIKAVLKAMGEEAGYKNWTTPLPNVLGTDSHRRMIERFIPNNTPWLLKTTWILILSDFFARQWPEAKWLLLKRPIDHILNSTERHPGMQKRDIKTKFIFIRTLQQRQDVLSSQLNNVLTVDVDAIISRKNDELERVFNFVDIEMDEEIVNNWLNPEIYHA